MKRSRTGRPGLQIDETGVHITMRLTKDQWLFIVAFATQRGLSHSEVLRMGVDELRNASVRGANAPRIDANAFTRYPHEVAVTQLAESGTPEVVGSIPTSDASDPNMGSLAPVWGFEDEWE